MTRLVEVLQHMNLQADIDLAGRWARLQGQHCVVYVVELAWGAGYYTWCDHPCARTVESYSDPLVAIQAGLRRAAQHAGVHHNNG